MKISVATKRLFTLLSAVLFALVPVAAAHAAAATHVVISQVYGGGGGTSTSTTYSYNTDYVELYNPTSSAISLAGLSIQYGSTTGNFGSVATNIKALTGTIQPGHYYLVSGAPGTQGGTLPTSDEIGSFSLSATGGKVALVTGTTALGTSTPCIASNIVDEVSYGTGTSCYEGTGAAPAPSNTTSVARKDPTSDTNDNSVDFAAVTPVPHNSSFVTTPTTALSVVSATATPSSLMAGTSTLLSVTVSPASNSTGIAVVANLSGVGGSATQSLALSSTANVYTYTLNVGGAVVANTYALPVTATDQESGNAAGSISLTVQTPLVITPIPTLQANRSTYAGTKVTTTGVVTSLLYNGFFIQLPSSTPGSTGVAEGMDVYTSTAPTVSIGDNVTVTGSLQLYPAATASVTPALELTSPAIVTNSRGNGLPAPIALTTANLTPSGGLQQLTKYEGMRVSFASLTSISGTGGGTLDEVNEIYPSSGQFYVTITGTPRPFREPGIDVRDAAAKTAPATVPRFDDNPERILVDTSVGLNSTPLNVSTGATLTNITGVLDFTYSSDSYYDPSRFIPDVATILPGYTPGMTVVALPLPVAGQFTVGSYNIERFFNTNSADNLDFYPVTGQVETSLAVTVTQAAYTRRLTKVSLAIRHVINNPDILAIEEAENGFVLKDIAAQISADAIAAGEVDPQYVAYGTDNATFYSNDESGISVGFLVKSTVDFISLNQFFNKTVFTPTGGSPTTTDDRPPFVLHAGVKRGTGVQDYPITVIVNHMKALPDTTVAVQQKKELQAEELAGLIQGYQANGEHVLAVGDFNYFEFSDGYIDELGTVTNRTVPANTVILPGTPGLVLPSPTDLTLTLPASQRQSYVEDGNAQVLDHIVATADLVATTTLAYAHLDADFPLISYNDATTPARVSDHDPAVAYLAIPAPVLSGTLTGTVAFPNTTLTTSSSGQVFTVTNTGQAPITIAVSITGASDFAQSNNCPASLALGATCAINVVFSPTATGARTGTLVVTSNATIAPLTLTGTGLPLSGTLTGTATFPNTTLTTSSSAQIFTATNTGGAAITITSIAASGDFVQTNTCGTTIAVGASCSISVVFTPTTTGARTGALTVNSNGNIAPVTLTGTGLPLSGTLTGNATFPNVTLTTSSSAQIFTATNTGGAAITITSIAATGDFVQTNSCGTTIAVGASCSISVIFTPTTTGTRTGALTVNSNGNIAPLTLTGTGLPLSGTLTGNATFPSTIQSLSSAAQVFTVANTGGAAISIASIAVTGDFTQTNTCTASLAVGASCSVSVVFTPTTTGTRTGTLTVTSNGNIMAATLTGTGLPIPTFTVADSTTAAATTTITLPAGFTATGSLKFTSVNNFAGAITVTCAAVGTAPAGATCTVTSPVTVAAAGTGTSTITITTSPHTIISGVGLPNGGRLAFLLTMLVAGALFTMRRAGRAVRAGGLLVVLAALLIGVSGCGTGSSLNTGANPNGTPSGTYNYTVTATASTPTGTMTKTQALVVVVQ